MNSINVRLFFLRINKNFILSLKKLTKSNELKKQLLNSSKSKYLFKKILVNRIFC